MQLMLIRVFKANEVEALIKEYAGLYKSEILAIIYYYLYCLDYFFFFANKDIISRY